MKHYGDITKINGAEAPVVDVITGGSPCQDLSVAGKRAGLAGERSGLFMEQIRIVKEMRERERATGRTGWMVRPRYMVWENVPGAFSSGNPKGADFAAVIEEIIKVAEPGASLSVCVPNGGWTKTGCYYAENGSWSLAWRVHDAQFWGVPQRRKRIALVADFGGLSAPEILFERKGLSGDSEQSGAQREATAAPTGGGAEGASGTMNPWDSQTARVYPDNGVWHCLNANENGGQSRDAVFCLQGNWIDRADTAGAVGGGAYPTVARSLTQRYDGSPCVDRGPNIVMQNAEPTPINTMIATRCKALGRGTGLGVSNPGDPAFTISAAHEHAVFCLQGNGIDRADTAGCNGKGRREDQSYTLNTIDRPAVAYSFDSLASNSMKSKNPYSGCRQVEVAKTLDCFDPNPSKNQGSVAVVQAVYDARGNGDGKTVCTITGDHQNRVTDYTALCVGNGQANQSVSDKAGALNTMHDQQAVMVQEIAHTLKAKANCDFRADSETYPVQNSVVRRLTPLECERLQGYPDGWTDIGEWVDSKGKKHGEADSPRYKALGNSIALPFWQWMARRICAQYERPVTMASLFDGIGGFPLVFQRCGALPVWASEIEEFPIAVTKVRFPDENVI